MNKEGFVIETNGEFAKVKLLKHSACGDCGACQMGEENMNISVDSLNNIGAKAGDKVEVDLGTQNVLSAAFIVYMIPLGALLLGIGATQAILRALAYAGNIEVISAVVGAVLMAAVFIAIRLNDKKLYKSKKYLTTITRIVE